MRNPLAEDYAPGLSDEALVDLALGGARHALNDLVRRHQGWIYNVALVRMLQNPQDAEDATQEGLLKIVTGLAGFRRESAFRTRAYRTAWNAVSTSGDTSPGSGLAAKSRSERGVVRARGSAGGLSRPNGAEPPHR